MSAPPLLEITDLSITYRTRRADVEAVRGMVARGLGFSVLTQQPVLDGTYSGGRVEARPIAADDAPARSPASNKASARS